MDAKPETRTEAKKREVAERKAKREQDKLDRIAWSVRVPFNGYHELVPYPYTPQIIQKNMDFYYSYATLAFELGQKDILKEVLQDLDENLEDIRHAADIYSRPPNGYAFAGMKDQWEKRITMIFIIRKAFSRAYRAYLKNPQ